MCGFQTVHYETVYAAMDDRLFRRIDKSRWASPLLIAVSRTTKIDVFDVLYKLCPHPKQDRVSQMHSAVLLWSKLNEPKIKLR